MKKLLSAFAASLLLVGATVVLNACEGVSATYTTPEPTIESVDAGPSSVDAASADKGSSVDAAPAPDAVTSTHPCVDNDHDGYCVVNAKGEPVDCNDSPLDKDGDGIVDGFPIHPGAAEICNMIDDNCDGHTDEGLEKVLNYVDGDNDGYGDINDPGAETCLAQGFVTDNGDCDDNAANIHPGAPDKPNDGIDSDCDDESQKENAPPTETAVHGVLTVQVPNKAALVLSYQFAKSEDLLGKWWEPDVAKAENGDEVGTSFVMSKDIAFVRLNVTIGTGDAATWLCSGSGNDAALLKDAKVKLEFGGGALVGEPYLWSAPEGGCSVVFPIAYLE
ncbi:putative metal-binding motif-containing protein [Candidatus Uhrbacteria bacterium]|nr:putative metal-binding motif-containing protein [Candidatus Uhrbacteria bacterium]